MLEKLREAWSNAVYKGLVVYVSVLVTLIFGFQMYRYFVSAPSSEITCEKPSAVSLVPLIGVFLDG